MKTARKKVGLALGSGGAKGLAHVGVLRALEKHKIPIDFISGASSGAYFGMLYAYYGHTDQVYRVAHHPKWNNIFQLFDLKFKKGVFKGDGYLKLIKKWVHDETFDKLRIPLSIVCTDILTGQRVVIREGHLAEAVRASMSVPVLFRPFAKEKHQLVDGGLSDPVPVDVVREMGADVVIAVNLDQIYFKRENAAKSDLNYFDLLNRTINLLRFHLAEYKSTGAEIILEPKADGYWRKFVEPDEMIEAGELVVEENIDKIKSIVESSI